MTITLDTKVAEILDNPQALEVLDSFVAGASKNPMLKMAKGFTLQKVAKTPAAKISMDQVNQFIDACNAKGL